MVHDCCPMYLCDCAIGVCLCRLHVCHTAFTCFVRHQMAFCSYGGEWAVIQSVSNVTLISKRDYKLGHFLRGMACVIICI